jgi:hypothetical protein
MASEGAPVCVWPPEPRSSKEARGEEWLKGSPGNGITGKVVVVGAVAPGFDPGPPVDGAVGELVEPWFWEVAVAAAAWGACALFGL